MRRLATLLFASPCFCLMVAAQTPWSDSRAPILSTNPTTGAATTNAALPSPVDGSSPVDADKSPSASEVLPPPVPPPLIDETAREPVPSAEHELEIKKAEINADATAEPELPAESPAAEQAESSVGLMEQESTAKAEGEGEIKAEQPIQPTTTDGMAVELAPETPIISSGKKFQFSIDVRAVYDDNIFFSSSDRQSDYIFIASPRLSLRTGDFEVREESYATLNYNPEAIFFVERDEENNLDHNLRTELQYTIARLVIGFDGSFNHLSGATPDLGDRAERNQASAGVRLAYGWGPSWEAENKLTWSMVDYDPAVFADFRELVNETMAMYQLTGKTKIGAGIGFGRLEVDGTSDQTFQRALIQVISNVSERLTAKLRGGMEFRDTEVGSMTTPIFALGLDYQLREGTTLGVEALRDVTASGSQRGDNIERTGIAARLRQRVGDRFVAGLDVGYEQADYTRASKADRNDSDDGKTSKNDDNREDNYFYFRPSLTYELREDRRLQLYYHYRSNESSTGDFDFDANQIGVSAGFDF